MFTQHHTRTRMMATLTLITLGACTVTARADFQVGGDDGARISDDGVLVFDDDGAVDRFIAEAVAAYALPRPGEDGGDEEIVIIDIALETATSALGFNSLATQLIEYENGAVSESELNVDALSVTDWVQQRLLNEELEIQIGGSVYKVMGGFVVEITDGDSTTLAWLREIQEQRRRFEIDGYGDNGVEWLSGVASNLVVHGWQAQHSRPELESVGDGMTQNYSEPVAEHDRPEMESVGDGFTRYYSEPTEQNNHPEVESVGGGLPRFFSEPVAEHNRPAMESVGDGFTRDYSEPQPISTRPTMQTTGLPDGMAYSE